MRPLAPAPTPPRRSPASCRGDAAADHVREPGGPRGEGGPPERGGQVLPAARSYISKPWARTKRRRRRLQEEDLPLPAYAETLYLCQGFGEQLRTCRDPSSAAHLTPKAPGQRRRRGSGRPRWGSLRFPASCRGEPFELARGAGAGRQRRAEAGAVPLRGDPGLGAPPRRPGTWVGNEEDEDPDARRG